MNQKQRGLTELHIAVILFGLAGLFGKLLPLNPICIVFGRVLFASLTLWIFASLYGLRIALPSTKDYFAFSLLGIVLAIHWATFFQAIQVSSVAIGLLTYSTFPVFVVFLEPFILQEKLRTRDVLLAVITFLGIVLVVPKYEVSDHVTQGVLFGVVSGGSFAILSILNRKYVQGQSSLLVALYQDAVAAIVLLPFVVYIRPKITPHDLFLLLFLGVLFTAVAHSLFIKGMAHVKTKYASIIASLESVYGIIFAAAVLGEFPTYRTIVGGGIVLSAGMYATLTSHTQDRD